MKVGWTQQALDSVAEIEDVRSAELADAAAKTHRLFPAEDLDTRRIDAQ